MQNNQTLQKSAEINFTIWIQLTSFWSMSCVFLCTLSICKVYYFASLLKPLLRAWFFSGFYLWPFDHVLNIMLCFLCLFVLLYDIGIMFDMIDMIWLQKYVIVKAGETCDFEKHLVTVHYHVYHPAQAVDKWNIYAVFCLWDFH